MSDANGAWLADSPGSVIRGTRSEWTQIVGVGVVSDGASQGPAYFCVKRRGTGTAWFDDFEIVETTRRF